MGSNDFEACRLVGEFGAYSEGEDCGIISCEEIFPSSFEGPILGLLKFLELCS